MAENASNLISNFDIIHIGDFSENVNYFNRIRDIYIRDKFEIFYDLKNINLKSEKSRIFFAGYKEINEVNNIVKAFDQSFFVQMSYSEGQSNSILEGMARGSICIVSEGCNMQKVSKVNAVKITDQENFSKDLNLLINDKDLFKMIKNQHLFLSKNNSFKKLAEDLQRNDEL